MIIFRCGRCAGRVEAGDSESGRALACPSCGHTNVCPPPNIPSRSRADAPPAHGGSSRGFVTAALVVVVGGAAWVAWSTLSGAASGASAGPAGTASAPDALQQELLRRNLDEPGDPVLDAKYQQINARHFGGALPPMPVRWEPGLDKVGELAGRAFSLEGMFGHVGKRALILLKPELQSDPRALARALCHEMVHAYLYTVGDSTTTHGPSFQAVLKRLSLEGAFEGIVASDEERASLRAWLDAEKARLDAERAALEQLDGEIQRERAEVERAFGELNARMSAGQPASESEIAAATARRDAYNQRATEANDRVARNRADHAAFAREAERYNLMLVYPDGVLDGAGAPGGW
jgi:hypothetical protein